VVEGRRRELVRQAFFLEYVTLAWMVIEAAVAIGAGLAARSITLLAFGIDSVIELTSATVLIWRLSVELQHGQSFGESAERVARRIGAALLFALAAYVVAAAGWSLLTRQGAKLLVAGTAHQHRGHPGYVDLVAAQAAHRRRTWQPSAAHRCRRINNLRVALDRCRNWAARAAHACRVVG